MLKEMRIKAGLTQKELSEKTEIGLRMIQAYEQRQKNINISNLDKLLKLSLVLNCTISDILDDDELKEKCKKARLS